MIARKYRQRSSQRLQRPWARCGHSVVPQSMHSSYSCAQRATCRGFERRSRETHRIAVSCARERSVESPLEGPSLGASSKQCSPGHHILANSMLDPSAPVLGRSAGKRCRRYTLTSPCTDAPDQTHVSKDDELRASQVPHSAKMRSPPRDVSANRLWYIEATARTRPLTVIAAFYTQPRRCSAPRLRA